MEVVPSFNINHLELKPGIYISREDAGFITFDIRITEPNKEPALSPAVCHTLEHFLAVYFRSLPIKQDVIYVGLMACCTGAYIVMRSGYTIKDMKHFVIECLEWILHQDEVPAAHPEMCGNYLLHDLPMCKWEASRYLLRLKNNFCCEYPRYENSSSNSDQ